MVRCSMTFCTTGQASILWTGVILLSFILISLRQSTTVHIDGRPTVLPGEPGSLRYGQGWTPQREGGGGGRVPLRRSTPILLGSAGGIPPLPQREPERGVASCPRVHA
jgi:hypothetical protein